MKKPIKFLGALACAAALLLQVGCSSIGPKSVVATVNGENIYRWELDNLYEKNLDQYNEIQTNMLGEQVNVEDRKWSEERLKFRQDLLDTLVNNAVLVQYGNANGFALTDEEKKAAEQEYTDVAERNIQYYMDNDYKDDANARQKAEAKWEESLKEQNLSKTFMIRMYENEKVLSKVEEYAYQDLKASDEEIQTMYDSVVADQKEQYDANPKEYLTDAAAPSERIFYNPAGFVRVKQILIAIPEEYNEQIIQKDKRLAEIIVEQQSDITDAERETLEQEKGTLEDERDALYEKAYESIQVKADEALAKAKAGEDFDGLVKEYGDDPVMKTEPFNEIGILYSHTTLETTNVEGQSVLLTTDIQDAVSKLETVGQTSDIIKTTEGLYILELASIIEEGPAPLDDDKKAFISTMLMATPQLEALDVLAQEQRANPDTKIKIYESRI